MDVLGGSEGINLGCLQVLPRSVSGLFGNFWNTFSSEGKTTLGYWKIVEMVQSRGSLMLL